jgi:thiol-disulfide isomerase/thioredoxin
MLVYLCSKKPNIKKMKKLLMLLAIVVAFASCKKENLTEYVINGNAEGIHNGIRVRLTQIDSKGKQVIKDSAIVMNGKFNIKGSVEEPSIYFLLVDGKPGNFVFMLENSNINIDLDQKVLMNSKITGSESNIIYEAFQEGMLEFKEESESIIAVFKELRENPNPKTKDSITKVMDDLRQRQTAYPLNFIQDNSDSYFSLNLIQLESSRPGFDIANYMKVFESFPEHLKTSKKGLVVKQKLDELYKEYEKLSYLNIGKVAPSFESQTPDGKILKLDDIKGKVTIIDFWAAWCGPCRRENPNVVKVYNKYHSKGLEIIGVSLDGAPNQKDPKKAWLAAIEKDGLEWNHVSGLKYFRDPVAELYNIKSIPATFILDAEGKIVAKNLRGVALENKISELLD